MLFSDESERIYKEQGLDHLETFPAEVVKAAARDLTEDCSADGVALALQRYVLA